jgi:hydrogenase expression/formation protein HypC
MCLATPGKIISIKKEAGAGNETALVDFDGLQKEVNVSLVKTSNVGDFLIVHAGFAIQKISQEDASDVLKIYEESKKISHAH